MSDSISSFTNIRLELEKHGTYASLTSGTSMRPLFKTHRDVVIIKKPSRELKKYDVVLYQAESGEYTLHRIIKVREDDFVIRGDNTYVKEYIKKDRIIGLLDGFNRNGKRHSVNDGGYKFYSRFWNFLYPLRLCLYKTRILLSKIYHKIFGRKPK